MCILYEDVNKCIKSGDKNAEASGWLCFWTVFGLFQIFELFFFFHYLFYSLLLYSQTNIFPLSHAAINSWNFQIKSIRLLTILKKNESEIKEFLAKD